MTKKNEFSKSLESTPKILKITIGGSGGECFIGTADRRIYDYFKERKIDLNKYANDWDNDLAVPEDFQPFPPGEPYNCNNLCHAGGADMDGNNSVVVRDDKGKAIWKGNLDLAWLRQKGIATEERGSVVVKDEPDGSVIFWGGRGEKGDVFVGQFEIREPFDPLKLKIFFCNADGWHLCDGVQYNGQPIENDDCSSAGKWEENKWIIVGGESVYELESDEEDNLDVSPEEWFTEMWDLLTEYQWIADAKGIGEEWGRMCKEQSKTATETVLQAVKRRRLVGSTAAIVFEVTELLACLEDGERMSALEKKIDEIVVAVENALAIIPDELDD
jgi:hypothetical protein